MHTFPGRIMAWLLQYTCFFALPLWHLRASLFFNILTGMEFVVALPMWTRLNPIAFRGKQLDGMLSFTLVYLFHRFAFPIHNGINSREQFCGFVQIVAKCEISPWHSAMTSEREKIFVGRDRAPFGSEGDLFIYSLFNLFISLQRLFEPNTTYYLFHMEKWWYMSSI